MREYWGMASNVETSLLSCHPSLRVIHICLRIIVLQQISFSPFWSSWLTQLTIELMHQKNAANSQAVISLFIISTVTDLTCTVDDQFSELMDCDYEGESCDPEQKKRDWEMVQSYGIHIQVLQNCTQICWTQVGCHAAKSIDCNSFNLLSTTAVSTSHASQRPSFASPLTGGAHFQSSLSWCYFDGNLLLISFSIESTLIGLSVNATLSSTWSLGMAAAKKMWQEANSRMQGHACESSLLWTFLNGNYPLNCPMSLGPVAVRWSATTVRLLVGPRLTLWHLWLSNDSSGWGQEVQSSIELEHHWVDWCEDTLPPWARGVKAKGTKPAS